MTSPQPPVSWERPPEPGGPAPGVAYAPHGDRLIAYVLDGVILSVFLILATLVATIVLGTGVSGTPENPTVSPAAVGGFTIFLVIIVVVATLYFPWFWVRGGATPGMKRFKLRVVKDADGGPIGWGSAILRVIGMWVSSLVFYLGFAWVLIDSRRRGWHDLIAGTVVVKDS
jgi:uncharacterized RDD family membrane protein YckC